MHASSKRLARELKDKLKSYKDPGWYKHPKGTVSTEATAAELKRDGIAP